MAFQSLLFWISRFGVLDAIESVGFSWFQSLLFWISRFGVALPRFVISLQGFNPCCFGLAVLARGVRVGELSASGFQSLLFWISRFGLAVSLAPPAWTWKFQSLLFWISRFGGPGLRALIGRGQVSILVVLD